MDKFSALIIDDEKRGRSNLSILLTKYCPEIEIIGEAADPIDAKEKILSLHPEVLFLDVQMPDLNGFDLLESLNKKNFAVVIVTAHSEYGIQAVKAGATDYILKPIIIKELQQAVNKIVDYYKNKTPESAPDITSHTKISLAHNRGFAVLEVNDIVTLEADGNYTKVVTVDNKTHLVSKSLKVFDDSIKTVTFFRIHRSLIVNLNYVIEFRREDGGLLIMNDGTRIQIPKAKIPEFIETMKKLAFTI